MGVPELNHGILWIGVSSCEERQLADLLHQGTYRVLF